jgi:hypothetical protein
MALMASVSFTGVCSAAPDQVTFLQDENFFLQDEIKKLQVELIDKDNAFKKLLLEREAVRHDLGVMAREKEVLEDKVSSLHKMVDSCDRQILRHSEQAVIPCRSQLKDVLDQTKVMAMALEEKNLHIARVTSEIQAVEDQVRVLTAEKTSLLQSIKKISAEYDELKGMRDAEVADAKADAQARVRDLQVRLTAEQTLVQEKIKQAKKPLENKMADMEAACKVREAEALQQGKLPQALLQEKIRKLEQQIDVLRQNAAAEINKLKEELKAGKQG